MAGKLRTIDQLDLAGKRVFIRVDFNVPLDAERRVADDARIRAALPTIQYAIGKRAKVILASHLGRPKGDPSDREKFSLEPAAERLSELLKQDVILADDCVGDAVKKLVRDASLGVERHVEVDADEHALPREVELVDRPELPGHVEPLLAPSG